MFQGIMQAMPILNVLSTTYLSISNICSLYTVVGRGQEPFKLSRVDCYSSACCQIKYR